MGREQKFIKKKDCRLCVNYMTDLDVKITQLVCMKGHFNYIDNHEKPRGQEPSFQCKGSDYVFDPDGRWAHIYDKNLTGPGTA